MTIIKKYQGDRIPANFGEWVCSAVNHTALGTTWTMEKVDDPRCRFNAKLDVGCSLRPGDVITMFSMLPVEKTN